MQAISQITETDFYAILGKSQEIYIPILKSKLSLIAGTKKETFQYGLTERHKLDVYYPPEGTTNAPILFWVYGGGFVSGERNKVPGIIYDNMGSYFARQGILTVVADYRLAPTFTYPAPIEDIRDALKFVITSTEFDEARKGVNTNRVFFVGHSAGATHVSGMLLKEDILTDEYRARIKGIILIAGGYSVNPVSGPYYGEGDKVSKSPIGLLDSKTPEKCQQLLSPRILIQIGDNDPFLLDAGNEFEAKLKEKDIQFEKTILKGHNHFTPELAPSSGDGEEGAEDIVRFVRITV